MDYREQKRFFIVNPGRTGSTLLAAILADAGADFCFETPESWDPTTGDTEMNCFPYRRLMKLAGLGMIRTAHILETGVLFALVAGCGLVAGDYKG